MEKVFTWRQRRIVYSTNLAVIGAAALVGVAVDVLIIENEKYIATAFAAVISLPIAMWLTIRRIRKCL